jgi:predicted nuclease of predicted toxin-antitoxin system
VRFLLDNNVSYRLCPLLEAAGHEAVHVGSLSMAEAEDIDILEHARSTASVIISSDTDFGTLLAFQRATSRYIGLELLTERQCGLLVEP